MKLARSIAVRIVLPLALGAALYLLLRNDDIALFRWVEALGAGHLLGVVRGTTRGLAAHVPHAFLGSFPDGAWAYAFGAGMALVWRSPSTRGTRAARAWLVVGFLVAVGIEAGQGIGVVPGVFDPLDLAAIAVGYLVPAFGSFRAETRSNGDAPGTRLPPCASSSPPRS